MVTYTPCINGTLPLKVVYENIVLPLETDKPQE